MTTEEKSAVGRRIVSPFERPYFEPLDTDTESSSDIFPNETKSITQEIKKSRTSVPLTRAINFREHIRANFETNLKPDVDIAIGDQVIKCQSSVLELYSVYMRHLRPLPKYLELPAEKITPEAMQCVYDWMCNRKYKLQRETILEVHVAAKFLKIDDLIDQSWQCIASPLINEDRAFMMYLEAIFYELPAVQSAMISRVRKFFLTLVGFVQFVELPFGHVCEMLASDTLGVNCELEVFFACVRYLNSHWEDRKERVFEMLRNVRFGLLPPHILVSFRFKKESPEINRMLENARVEKLLSQTMHFSIGLGTPPTSSLLFKEREWIYDLDCEYHSTKSLPERKRPTYEKFLEYIRFLAKAETHWTDFENAHDVEKAAQLMLR